MPWNEADRAKYEVIRKRYSSDLSDAELALIFPLSSDSRQRRGGSRPNHACQGALGNVCFGVMADNGDTPLCCAPKVRHAI